MKLILRIIFINYLETRSTIYVKSLNIRKKFIYFLSRAPEALISFFLDIITKVYIF